jgi:predicted MFS family arabinose efflux permease
VGIWTPTDANAAANPNQSPSAGDRSAPSARSLSGLDWLNFFLADVQTGVGPFLAIYLAGYRWNEQSVGLALRWRDRGHPDPDPCGCSGRPPQIQTCLDCRGNRSAGGRRSADRVPASLLVRDVGPSPDWRYLERLCPGHLRHFNWYRGRRLFDRRQGRNQAFNSAGNVAAAMSMGLLGYFVSNRSIFFFVAACALPTILTLLIIRPGEIDYERARGAREGEKGGKAESVWVLFRERTLVLFLVCAVLFHFANAAMLPLLGEMLAKGQGRSSMMFMSACVVTTQLVITLIAAWVGRKAGAWGRKPLLLIAFGVLPVRGLLYTLTHRTAELVAIQILDGVGAGIFGVVSVLVIADLTQGSGRFNLTLGAISTAVGIGASLSQVIAGSIVHHFSFNAGFLFLACIAAIAFGILYCFMPETRDKQFLNPIKLTNPIL